MTTHSEIWELRFVSVVIQSCSAISRECGTGQSIVVQQVRCLRLPSEKSLHHYIVFWFCLPNCLSIYDPLPYSSPSPQDFVINVRRLVCICFVISLHTHTHTHTLSLSLSLFYSDWAMRIEHPNEKPVHDPSESVINSSWDPSNPESCRRTYVEDATAKDWKLEWAQSRFPTRIKYVPLCLFWDTFYCNTPAWTTALYCTWTVFHCSEQFPTVLLLNCYRTALSNSHFALCIEACIQYDSVLYVKSL